MDWRMLVLLACFGGALATVKKDQIIDLETSESDPNPQVVRPLTFGAAVLSEVQRLQSLQDVFLRDDLSYYTPYGERMIVSVKFPSVSKEVLANARKSGYGYGPPPQKDQYGPPKPVYGVPNQKPAKPGDIGVIVSQNYIYRENHRDYLRSQRRNQSRPSSELIIELAKAFGEKNIKQSSPIFQKSHGAAPEAPSYVIVAIESRLKTSPETRNFGFVGGNSLTNGTIIFPSPKSPTILTHIPFILRNSDDVEHVFDGYHSDSDRLIPNERTEIINFIRLLSDLHADVHQEGGEAISRLRRLGDGLVRPRLPRPKDLPPNLQAEADIRSVLTNWLCTSTVGLRTFTFGSSSGSYDGVSDNRVSKNIYKQLPKTSYDPFSNDAFTSYNAPPPHPSNAGNYQTLASIPSNPNYTILKA